MAQQKSVEDKINDAHRQLERERIARAMLHRDLPIGIAREFTLNLEVARIRRDARAVHRVLTTSHSTARQEEELASLAGLAKRANKITDAVLYDTIMRMAVKAIDDPALRHAQVAVYTVVQMLRDDNELHHADETLDALHAKMLISDEQSVKDYIFTKLSGFMLAQGNDCFLDRARKYYKPHMIEKCKHFIMDYKPADVNGIDNKYKALMTLGAHSETQCKRGNDLLCDAIDIIIPALNVPETAEAAEKQLSGYLRNLEMLQVTPSPVVEKAAHALAGHYQHMAHQDTAAAKYFILLTDPIFIRLARERNAIAYKTILDGMCALNRAVVPPHSTVTGNLLAGVTSYDDACKIEIEGQALDDYLCATIIGDVGGAAVLEQGDINQLLVLRAISGRKHAKKAASLFAELAATDVLLQENAQSVLEAFGQSPNIAPAFDVSLLQKARVFEFNQNEADTNAKHLDVIANLSADKAALALDLVMQNRHKARDARPEVKELFADNKDVNQAADAVVAYELNDPELSWYVKACSALILQARL